MGFAKALNQFGFLLKKKKTLLDQFFILIFLQRNLTKKISSEVYAKHYNVYIGT